ncbi:ABC transporter permease subunit [sulfur-oxidizing endosymbiont of Gigantopelta aegis]|uniref:ABC transporter permease subunit n=1 Tax=sulfur-oxidizing endosymbiont of Gigantopelta aegis TaxID=2794934 RepID=UPI0018DD1FBB|nr:ABC transporter permease subunit [sulfur-oxidizing endosymbiont of Gigantopelta aegis]
MTQRSTTKQASNSIVLPSEHPQRLRHWKFRVFKDKLAQIVISLGGNSVIVAILLIFFYLVYETAPLLKGADISSLSDYSLTDHDHNAKKILTHSYYSLEEQGEIAVQFALNGDIRFFASRLGKTASVKKPSSKKDPLNKTIHLTLPQDVSISSFYAAHSASGLVAYGLSNGQLILLKHDYKISYPNEQRLITPEILYPMGKSPMTITESGEPLALIAFEHNDDEMTFVSLLQDKRLIMSYFSKEESLTQLSLEPENEASAYQRQDVEIPLTESLLKGNISQLLINREQNQLFIAYRDQAGRSLLEFYSLRDKAHPQFVQQVLLAEASNPVTVITYLTGKISLLVGQQSGRISQWFPVTSDGQGEQLKLIREFNDQHSPITVIQSEIQRKGFMAGDQSGTLGIYHSTAEKTLLLEKIAANPIAQLAIAPRANFLLSIDDQANVVYWAVDNEHPEISWHSMWDKVWYESYPQAEYIWQSSSASNDFEPKFSLTPLAFGTLKAAFYAMLFAIPLAIMGAIYTAYFMSPRVRGLVKPSIEIMEALPTVILGFLAGLWLAPLIEDNLPAVFILLLVLPLSVLLTAWAWHSLPKSMRQSVPEGWEAFILMPVLIFVIWATFALSLPIEKLFFDGDMQSWLTNEIGLDFNQRNSIVVGIAMGFAVIPTVFSITEDAIFSVPKHLTLGSLALGATRWQTLIRVVILTASPAIFSAVMIGFGRAIGETMIVLMATGNTPIMDFSLFQGMRTLSANVAVEVPESEVDSSHYRVLFLAALVLFAFTFFFNTIAELIRQRLRHKYSNL